MKKKESGVNVLRAHVSLLFGVDFVLPIC